ncbi:hypothetical protein [uncultured Thiohalocapsa sp.]|uniref:hypothetical protein n=1 Tax=uncultured Thiohalocapsa sp. TaxID=768990 RepID=UPI0025E31BF5|nr:hypothetical protein [uncultured Thiohalocapsa sp.]
MHPVAATYPLLDLRRLPRARVSAGAVTVAVTFRETWADGLGARGWKLDANLDDPEIIAATSTPGETIPTSVPVHDILDHLLCGFAPSGHRAEAMALAQLAQRTDTDPTPDYRQMVHEDLLQGRILGESPHAFIGAGLRAHLPRNADAWDGRTLMAALRAQLGEALLTELLVVRLRALGQLGRPHAMLAWRLTGFDFRHRGRLGDRLQRLLERMDAWVRTDGRPHATGEIRLRADLCEFAARNGPRLRI